ncbi:peroxiredoxin-like family protein [uncultured Pseudodesulfovibrio sp.]|uniref:peroxiredoxin-like family protein n=1 Tax=uncultured Pseudodesulfovibrio sp. TaxID=2035858 RepID=UPI0029C60A92|nr:peroxiredoxin-like family protein [uncultured Pseudodesulfovibrio sp.]
MSLAEKINEINEEVRVNIPVDIQAVMAEATQTLSESDLVSNAPKAGDTMKNFTLPNALGEERSLDTLREIGPVVVTFYRGGWCPYCNLELRAYQHVLSDITAAGASLVAITPELPDASLSTIEKNGLGFEVLTDENSNYARKLGLVFTLPEELQAIYTRLGLHLEKHNGQGQFDLPLVATFIVGVDGTILSAFVDADYRVRKEPSEIVEELKLKRKG